MRNAQSRPRWRRKGQLRCCGHGTGAGRCISGAAGDSPSDGCRGERRFHRNGRRSACHLATWIAAKDAIQRVIRRDPDKWLGYSVVRRQVGEDLLRSAGTFLRGAFHEPLEALRAMFAGKMAIALAHSFIAAEFRVLTDLPASVTAEKMRCLPRCRQRRPSVPERTNSRPRAICGVQEFFDVAHNVR